MSAENRWRPPPFRASRDTVETAVIVAKINELRYSHAFHNNDADLVTHERKVLQTVAYQEQSQPSVRPARRSGHRVRAAALAVVAFLVAAPVLAGTILGTKHDFLGLNGRVGVVAMGGDMTVFKPDGWQSSKDAALHLRLNGGDDLMSCGKCHNGRVAHSIAIKHIGTDLTNDHAISMTYAGLNSNDQDFRTPDGPYGFDNGIKLYDGKVECATCHNVHNPDVKLLLRTRADRLCETCHIK